MDFIALNAIVGRNIIFYWNTIFSLTILLTVSVCWKRVHFFNNILFILGIDILTVFIAIITTFLILVEIGHRITPVFLNELVNLKTYLTSTVTATFYFKWRFWANFFCNFLANCQTVTENLFFPLYWAENWLTEKFCIVSNI